MAALHDMLPLRIVISTGVVVVLSSLIPILLSSFALSDRAVWTTSAAVLLFFNIAQAAFVFLRFIGSEFSVRSA